MRTIAVALTAGVLMCASAGFTETAKADTSRGTRLGQLSRGAVEFGGRMQMSFPNEGTSLSIEPVLGYFVTREFEVECEVEVSHSRFYGDSYNSTAILGKGLINISTGTLAVPYGFFGLGFEIHFGSADHSEGRGLLRFGGGTRLFVTESWNLRAELRSEKIYEEDMADISTKLMVYITGLVIP